MCYRDFVFLSLMYILKNNKDGLEDRCDFELLCFGNFIIIFDGEIIYVLIIVIIE